MNRDKLRKSLYAGLRLRPAAKSVQPDGSLVAFDDFWTLEEVGVDGVVRLTNPRTGHVAKLGLDHIHHFDSDPSSNTATQARGFLNLRVQVFIQGPRMWVEPIPYSKNAA